MIDRQTDHATEKCVAIGETACATAILPNSNNACCINDRTASHCVINITVQPDFRGWLVEQGLTSTRHSLGHFGDDVFTGQMTQPTVSKH